MLCLCIGRPEAPYLDRLCDPTGPGCRAKEEPRMSFFGQKWFFIPIDSPRNGAFGYANYIHKKFFENTYISKKTFSKKRMSYPRVDSQGKNTYVRTYRVQSTYVKAFLCK